jgi:tetratricopeptide (TPR) repeat protein
MHHPAISLVLPVGFVVLGLAAMAQSVTLPIVETKDPNAPNLGYQGHAIILLQQGKNEEALQAAQLGMKKAQESGNEQMIASANAVLGKVYRRMNRAEESLSAYQKAFDYWKTQPKPEYMLGLILNNIGEQYKAMGQLDKARATLEQAASDLQTGRENLRQSPYKMDLDLPGCAVVYENLGQVYFMQGKLQEAETSLKKAIEAADKEPDRRSQVDSRLGLIMVLTKQKRTADVQHLAQETIERIKLLSGPNDPRITALEKLKSAGQPEQSAASNVDDNAWKLQTKMALEAMQSGKFSEAEKRLQTALREAERFGTKDPRLAISLSNLGVMYVKLGKFQQAEQYLQRGLPIARTVFGPQSQQVAAILDSLVPAYIKQGKFEQAEPILKEFIPIQEKTPGYSKEAVEATRGVYKNLQAAIQRRKLQRQH